MRSPYIFILSTYKISSPGWLRWDGGESATTEHGISIQVHRVHAPSVFYTPASLSCIIYTAGRRAAMPSVKVSSSEASACSVFRTANSKCITEPQTFGRAGMRRASPSGQFFQPALQTFTANCMTTAASCSPALGVTSRHRCSRIKLQVLRFGHITGIARAEDQRSQQSRLTSSGDFMCFLCVTFRQEKESRRGPQFVAERERGEERYFRPACAATNGTKWFYNRFH